MEYLRKLAAITQTGMYYLLLVVAALAPLCVWLWQKTRNMLAQAANLRFELRRLRWQKTRNMLAQAANLRFELRRLRGELALANCRLEISEAARIKFCRDKADLACANARLEAQVLAGTPPMREALEQLRVRPDAARNAALRQADEIRELEPACAKTNCAEPGRLLDAGARRLHHD